MIVVCVYGTSERADSIRTTTIADESFLMYRFEIGHAIHWISEHNCGLDSAIRIKCTFVQGSVNYLRALRVPSKYDLFVLGCPVEAGVRVLLWDSFHIAAGVRQSI